MRFGLFIAIFFFFRTVDTFAQQKDEPIKVVEFSGKVVYEDENGNPAPLPYTNVAVKGTNRGAFTEFDGFFALVALAGETVVFSRIGYKTVEIKIPDKLISDRYTWVQIMTEDNYVLPEAVIMPWPSKEHFKQEFLAIDISNELRENAMANLADEKMKEMGAVQGKGGTMKMIIREERN